MATKTHTLPSGRDVSFSQEQAASPSFASSWLSGLMLLIIIALVASLLNSAAMMPRTSDGVTGPMVLPEGSTMPGYSRVKDGNQQALESIAGVPSVSSPPNTDRLPGRDDRKPQPVPAPL